MTRDEAIKKAGNACPGRAQWLVDSLIALDILKVEEPKDAKTLAIQALSTTVVGVGNTALQLDARSAFDIVELLARAGLEIVRK